MLLAVKALRTIWRNKKAYIACITLLAIGVAVYTAFNLLHLNLKSSIDRFYTEQRFADGFARVRGMPAGAVDYLSDLPGIESAVGTLTLDVRVMMPGVEKIVTLRLTSYDDAQAGRLNDPLVWQGVPPGPEEMLLGKSFADAHGLVPGDSLTMVMGGREVTRIISGIIYSPEYVYVIPDLATMLPDDEAFGFAYLPAHRLAALAGRVGELNEVSVKLLPGVKWEEVRYLLEDALSGYGLISLVSREDQLSNAMMQQEIDSIEGMSTAIPALFVMIAVVILSIMMRRVIEQERGQIGILKAFGFTSREVLVHYMSYGLITGAAGGIAGVLLGLLMADGLTGVYLVYFQIPNLGAATHPRYILAGLMLAVGSGVFGSLMGARSALRLSPSEAMRPPSPPPVKGDLLGKLGFLRHILTSHGFMAVRSISRGLFRSAFVVVGMAISFAVMAFISSYNHMFDVLLFDQFTKSQVYDMKITVASPGLYEPMVESSYRIGGVKAAEAILELPVEFSLRHLKETVMITAIPDGGSLYRIYDNELDIYYPPPRGGVILSSSLADKLMAARGDILLMTSLTTGRKDIRVPVLEVVNENLGSTAYMELESFCAMLDCPPTANSVIVRTGDPGYIAGLLRDETNILSVTDQTQALKASEDMMNTYGAMLYMMRLAGIGIAYAIIANTSAISLSERKREYATLRVLGMQPGEVSRIMSFEYWILTVLGILPGIPLTYLLKISLNSVMRTDMFSIPITTPLVSFVEAGLLCVVAVLISGFSARKKIAGFDMVEVLKERE